MHMKHALQLHAKSGNSRERSHSATRWAHINMLCCCFIEDSIWIGDTSGNLHAYSTKNYSHVFSYMLDPAIKSPVISLIHLKNIQRVSVGLQNGRIFLVDATKVPSNCAFAEGSFVLTEICSGLILHSACSTTIDGSYELWCGDTAGKINVFLLSTTGVCGHQALCHTDETNIMEDVKVARMCASDMFIFTSLYPGFVVYQWHAETKKLENKLDCSKLLPCSESLKSIAIDEHISLMKCQISALTVLGNEIYIGTTWGCIVVAEVSTLLPITVFRPYENEVKQIIAIPHPIKPLIVTVGRRYRSLISRFMDEQENTQKYLANPESSSKMAKEQNIDVDNHVHCILWRANNWN